MQVFFDRFVEREIQSLLVYCIHQEDGYDWNDELKKREVSTYLLCYAVQKNHDLFHFHVQINKNNIKVYIWLPWHTAYNLT